MTERLLHADAWVKDMVDEIRKLLVQDGMSSQNPPENQAYWQQGLGEKLAATSSKRGRRSPTASNS
jgi:hypothetical protein